MIDNVIYYSPQIFTGFLYLLATLVAVVVLTKLWRVI